MDGGITDFQPTNLCDDGTTITVSPFYFSDTDM